MLVLRPDHIGDVVLSGPAVELLRQGLPNAHITYVVGPWSQEAARFSADVDALRTISFPGFTRRANVNLVQPYVLLAAEATRLRKEQFDLAVILRPDHWWGALLAACAGIPTRVGACTPETQPLLTHTRRVPSNEHAVEQALRLARLALKALHAEPSTAAPRVRFAVPEAARRAAAELWQQHGLDGRQVVVVQPTAGARLKSWPLERWVELIDALGDQRVVLTGAPGDRALLERIRARCVQMPVVATGQSLVASAALFERAQLLIGLDGGAAHVAAALGVPTVRLYGPAPVTTYGPWPPAPDQRALVTSKLACVPCGALENPPCGAQEEPACLLALSTEEVLRAANAVLRIVR